ncbi:MHYT domain-containing protein [Bradyrhizobium sp. SYSU BS000235]|uniref:MHYT domain-containing protein n=1 Tax=Bradyrhizobium sp. SYSU BS000235 TaxID=3411332 RepID=UPI003C77E824
MFEGHDLFLVALSVAIAILGGYNGFALAARIRGRPDASHRVLLAGAAAFLAIGIWTMHFIGMLSAPLPPGTAYLVLPTIISFLICALVVGVSLFLVSICEPTWQRLTGSAVLLGLGICSMHYVGMHGLSGHFEMQHDPLFVVLSVVIAVGTAYGGLRAFLARQGGIQLVLSAVAFGLAVSGMHYTAMEGLHLVPVSGMHHHMEGLVASQQILSIVVALLCFVVAAGFLLLQVPDPRLKPAPLAMAGVRPGIEEAALAFDARELPTKSPAKAPTLTPVAEALPPVTPAEEAPAASALPGSRSAPLGGLGQPRRLTASRLPVEAADGTHFIDVSDVRSIRADAHYTRIHDGTRERMCPWSISEAETQLDPERFLRVHRSHIVALSHVTFVRREGDGAVIELDGAAQRVPVSRAKISEVKMRLGLIRGTA